MIRAAQIPSASHIKEALYVFCDIWALLIPHSLQCQVHQSRAVYPAAPVMVIIKQLAALQERVAPVGIDQL